jgi:hypothetical protein
MSATCAGRRWSPPEVKRVNRNPSHKVKQPEGRLSPSSSSTHVVGDGPPSARKQSAHSDLMNAVSHRPVTGHSSKMLSHQGDGPQGRGYSGYSCINRSRRRRVCSAAAAVVQAVRNVDYRPRHLARLLRRPVWQPTWLSSPPQVERDVPAKDSVFSSAS